MNLDNNQHILYIDLNQEIFLIDTLGYITITDFALSKNVKEPKMLKVFAAY